MSIHDEIKSIYDEINERPDADDWRVRLGGCLLARAIMGDEGLVQSAMKAPVRALEFVEDEGLSEQTLIRIGANLLAIGIELHRRGFIPDPEGTNTGVNVERAVVTIMQEVELL